MNQVQLIGRMAREPELRRTEKGTPVVSFALAVDRRFQRDTVDFVDCVAWRGTAEFVNKYFRKARNKHSRRPDLVSNHECSHRHQPKREIYRL